MVEMNSKIVFILSEIKEAAVHAGHLQLLKWLLTELVLIQRKTRNIRI